MTDNNWVLDKSHSEIHFRIRHMMISWVSGYFTEFDGDFQFRESSEEICGVDLRINVESISTGNPTRDDHLRSIDFFDAGPFPEIRFVSDGMQRSAEGDLHMPGELTIHGETRHVVLHVESCGTGRDPWGNERTGFSVSGSVNRKDFGIRWNASLETGGVLIGEEVQIRCDFQFLRKIS